MLGLIKYPDDFWKAHGLTQLWYKDTAETAAKADSNGFAARHTYLIQSPTVKDTYSLWIQLKHIFGFCQEYDKIVYGLKHSLTLDDDAIFRGAAAGAGKVSLDKISWFMPHVIPADAAKFSIYKTIESKVTSSIQNNTMWYVLSSWIDKFNMATERKDSSGETEIYYCWIPNS